MDHLSTITLVKSSGKYIVIQVDGDEAQARVRAQYDLPSHAASGYSHDGVYQFSVIVC